MKIGIASDHAGYFLKLKLISFLKSLSYEVNDFGCHSPESVDYPDFANLLSHSIQNNEIPLGILICGTGQGMAIAANKNKGIRAVCVNDLFSAQMSREHNDSNVLCLGARITDEAKAKRLIETWLHSSFQAGRHLKRIEKFEKYCQNN